MKPSAVKENSTLLLLEGLRRILSSKYYNQSETQIIENFINSTSQGQLKSKEWILKALKENEVKDLGVIFLCAGWYGFLAFFLLTDSFFRIKNIFLFETDLLSVQVSEDLNRHFLFVEDKWRFKSSLKNILDINYVEDHFQTFKQNGEVVPMIASPDTIINTACEHIKDFDLWWNKIPPKKLVILQSNNYEEIKEHVNCVSCLAEFKKSAPMGKIIYEGHLELAKYTRFMLIGYKS